ncbi:16530_t:CDS:1, partial [Acaulospora colombiana]
ASPVPQPTTQTDTLSFPDLHPRKQCRAIFLPAWDQTCDSIATKYDITVPELIEYNSGLDCDDV